MHQAPKRWLLHQTNPIPTNTNDNLLCSTMITFQKAKQIAEDEINKHKTLSDELLIIIDEQAVEKEYAWIFLLLQESIWK